MGLQRVMGKGETRGLAPVVGLQEMTKELAPRGAAACPPPPDPPKRCITEQKWLTNLHMAAGLYWRPQIELG